MTKYAIIVASSCAAPSQLARQFLTYAVAFSPLLIGGGRDEAPGPGRWRRERDREREREREGLWGDATDAAAAEAVINSVARVSDFGPKFCRLCQYFDKK